MTDTEGMGGNSWLCSRWLWRYWGSKSPTFVKISRKKSENCLMEIFITPRQFTAEEIGKNPHATFGEICQFRAKLILIWSVWSASHKQTTARVGWWFSSLIGWSDQTSRRHVKRWFLIGRWQVGFFRMSHPAQLNRLKITKSETGGKLV